MNNVYKLHGMPQLIVSDQDKVFLSSFWQGFFRLMGTSLKPSTAYHTQSDDQKEVVNKCVGSYLICMIRETPREWVKWLVLAK